MNCIGAGRFKRKALAGVLTCQHNLQLHASQNTVCVHNEGSRAAVTFIYRCHRSRASTKLAALRNSGINACLASLTN